MPINPASKRGSISQGGSVSKPEVLIVGTGPDWYLERIARDFTLHQIVEGNPSLLDRTVADRIEALIGAAPVGVDLMNALPRLRLIANSGAGYEKIDTEAAFHRNIIVTNTPDVTDGCVADMAFGLLLAVTRQIVRGDRFVRASRWLDEGYPLVRRVHGGRMGILGLGRIGLAIAKRAAGFDMPVSYHNRRPRTDVTFKRYGSLTELAAQSDFLVVACPGGPETRHIVNAEVLKALGPDGYIVNISRGAVIDEEALIAALKNGDIAGAGLDVFEDEPNVPDEFMSFDNVVLMPHRGGGTTETWEDACDLIKANLAAFFAGQAPPTPINPR